MCVCVCLQLTQRCKLESQLETQRVSPTHVQLAFNEEPHFSHAVHSCQTVSNGVYPTSAQGSQVHKLSFTHVHETGVTKTYSQEGWRGCRFPFHVRLLFGWKETCSHTVSLQRRLDVSALRCLSWKDASALPLVEASRSKWRIWQIWSVIRFIKCWFEFFLLVVVFFF